LLKTFIRSKLLAQDDFYHPRDSQHLEYIPDLDSYNFDTIRAIDMERFHAELKRLVDSRAYDYIILDGFLLYDDEKLNKLLDRKYFLYLNADECWRRRQSRNYCLADSYKYFSACVWPEFLKYKQRCEQKYDDIIYISGSDPIESVFTAVLNDLKRLND
jgi:uridine kinase